ncbi:unnamed protein product [Cuscuta epithymum]|uniref:Uncharacterized protein n=1 Tax=Cuscuta epithymum TaxID=186058 RepID=A0AAV0F6S4_9ASTE|nr:unnamed protein product [Cuscuta epithymum]
MAQPARWRRYTNPEVECELRPASSFTTPAATFSSSRITGGHPSSGLIHQEPSKLPPLMAVQSLAHNSSSCNIGRFNHWTLLPAGCVSDPNLCQRNRIFPAESP